MKTLNFNTSSTTKEWNKKFNTIHSLQSRPINNKTTKSSTYKFLREQIRRGCESAWFVSLHFVHPDEFLQEVKETKRPYGFGERIYFDSYGSHWNTIGAYESKVAAKRSLNETHRNIKDIRNKILKNLYGVKRLDRLWNYKLNPILFFTEKGKYSSIKDSKDQDFHLHIALPKIDSLTFKNEKNPRPVTEKNLRVFLERDLNGLKRLCKSTSLKRSIDVQEVEEWKGGTKGLFYYLNKETDIENKNVDFMNSLMLVPSASGGYEVKTTQGTCVRQIGTFTD